MSNFLSDRKCFGTKWKTESELRHFSFLFIAKTLSILNSIAHDQTLDLIKKYLEVVPQVSPVRFYGIASMINGNKNFFLQNHAFFKIECGIFGREFDTFI